MIGENSFISCSELSKETILEKFWISLADLLFVIDDGVSDAEHQAESYIELTHFLEHMEDNPDQWLIPCEGIVESIAGNTCGYNEAIEEKLQDLSILYGEQLVMADTLSWQEIKSIIPEKCDHIFFSKYAVRRKILWIGLRFFCPEPYELERHWQAMRTLPRMIRLASEKKIRIISVSGPRFLPDFPYEKSDLLRIRKRYGFPQMVQDVVKYKEHFSELLGDKFSEEYVVELSTIPGVTKRNGRYGFIDLKSKYFNAIDGERITVGQPEESTHHIYCYGSCLFAGYFVEDSQTVCSSLQKKLNEAGSLSKVVNRGIRGLSAVKTSIYNMIYELEHDQMSEGDIVLIAYGREGLPEILKTANIPFYDCTDFFHSRLKDRGNFYDNMGHMVAEDYSVLADYLYDILKIPVEPVKNIFEKKDEHQIDEEDFSEKLDDYISSVYQAVNLTGFSRMKGDKVGAIVMNANPFTLGHRYLVEQAAKQVDKLLLFVVEEDRSQFAFSDRIEMVRQGVGDLRNVFVARSGEFILSMDTLPEYFLKDQIPSATIDPTADLEMFGRYIAPEFHISIRFVGTEPIDSVTRQYNEGMKKELGAYGIELCEIERCKKGETVISASVIRKYLLDGRLDLAREMLPKTTLDYMVTNKLLT